MFDRFLNMPLKPFCSYAERGVKVENPLSLFAVGEKSLILFFENIFLGTDTSETVWNALWMRLCQMKYIHLPEI